MNALLAQFIPEARDLLEQAGTGLLVLEKAPGDPEMLNTVFRAAHTLKGASGLFDVAPLTRLVHAAEDLLGAVRTGRLAIDPDMIDLLLDSLDRVGAFIDSLEASESLTAEAGEQSRLLVERLRGRLGAAEDVPEAERGGPDVPAEAPSWLAELDEAKRIAAVRHVLDRKTALTAAVYEPAQQCFFQGEDPLLLVRQLPDLLDLRIDALADWPQLDRLDPYACILRFRLLAPLPASGLPGDGPVFADFVAQAHSLLVAGDRATLARAAVALRDLCAAELFQASALRWLLALLDTDAAPEAWLTGLIDSIASGTAPKWNRSSISASPPPSAPMAVQGAEDAEALRMLLAEQHRILGLPCADDIWQGRLEAAARTALNGLTAAGRAVPSDLAAATAASLEHRDAAPLRAVLAGLAGFAGDASPEPAIRATPADGPAEGAGGVRAEDHGEAKAPARLLRVDQAKVDALMSLIGELIVAKNSLPYLARRAEEVFGSRELAREIKDQYGVIHRLAQDMQAAIMSVRMLPVSQIFQRFPRLVRDLSRKLDKRIELAIEGEETEADKNVIENLADPLIHMVRNSIDHGIEAPEERRAAGKPDHGTIRLAARQENDNVIIEVGDDGRGIDPMLVRRHAVAKGVVDASRAEAMSDEEASMLIFAPGFSTKEQVSDLSGRGVGMDVVRSAVEKAGGRVALSSRPGLGTTVTLSLPLSMAVTRVMTIEVRGRLFGLPMDMIVETVRVPSQRIHRIKDREAFVLRDSLVPMVRLARLLGLDDVTAESEAEGADVAVMVVHLGAERIGVVVDAFRDGMEVIVKPMEGLLAGLGGYAGTALLGDGHVLLVLDLKELI